MEQTEMRRPKSVEEEWERCKHSVPEPFDESQMSHKQQMLLQVLLNGLRVSESTQAKLTGLDRRQLRNLKSAFAEDIWQCFLLAFSFLLMCLRDAVTRGAIRVAGERVQEV